MRGKIEYLKSLGFEISSVEYSFSKAARVIIATVCYNYRGHRCVIGVSIPSIEQDEISTTDIPKINNRWFKN